MYNSHTDIWIAGAFAAVVVDFIVYPFDTLKTRIQSPNYSRVFKNAQTGTVKRNVLFRGLYQGVWSVVFSTIPSSGAFFTTYEAVKHAFYNSSTNPPQGPQHHNLSLPFTHSLPTPVIHAIASSSAESVSCLMLTPAEVLKQNAQMINQSGSRTAMHIVLSRFRSHPWRLWSGYTALVARNLPFTAMQFPLFEFVRARVTEWRKRSTTTTRSKRTEALVERAGVTGVSAGLAGCVSALVTTPIDVVKTRVMLSADGSGLGGEGRTASKGALGVGKEIFRDEGFRGLFKGGAIRSGWTAVSLSLYLGLYEGGRIFLENRRQDMDGLSC